MLSKNHLFKCTVTVFTNVCSHVTITTEYREFHHPIKFLPALLVISYLPIPNLWPLLFLQFYLFQIVI